MTLVCVSSCEDRLSPPGHDAVLGTQRWPLFGAGWGLGACGSQVRLVERNTVLCSLYGASLGRLTDMQRRGYLFHLINETLPCHGCLWQTCAGAINIFTLCNHSERSTHTSLPQTCHQLSRSLSKQPNH